MMLSINLHCHKLFYNVTGNYFTVQKTISDKKWMVSIKLIQDHRYVLIKRLITVNFSFTVGRLHQKIIYQNAAWKLIIWLTTRKKIPTVFGKKGILKRWKGTRHKNTAPETEFKSKQISTKWKQCIFILNNIVDSKFVSIL